MQVIVAKHGGFCSGVRRAVDTAMRIDPKNVYILGELIHNHTVTDRIADRGILTVNSVEEVPAGSALIIRSHGVSEEVLQACEQRQIRIVDCTCPYVRRTQNIVKKRSGSGQTLIVIGEKSHPEVLGILGWFSGESYVVNTEEESLNPAFANKNLLVVAQTTFSEEKFKKIIKNITKLCKKTVEVFKTIWDYYVLGVFRGSAAQPAAVSDSGKHLWHCAVVFLFGMEDPSGFVREGSERVFN